jgi:diadenosine tetraphosphate (Ap4A) HIT family hydrolase
MNSNCPFCTVAAERPIGRNDFGFVIRREERDELMAVLEQDKASIEQEMNPAAYNIGINDDAAAGQTIPHLRIHLIPHYDGDLADPRDGMRYVIPETAKYWKD